MMLGSITLFVMGEMLLVDNHSTIAAFSYVCPSAMMVGCIMISKLRERTGAMCMFTTIKRLVTVHDD